MVPILETRRLLLKPLELSDARQIQEIFPQWEIVKYLRNIVPWPYPPNGAFQFVNESALPAMERGEAWHWTLRPKSEPEKLIGLITLTKSTKENRGFWLDPKWQGQGLMTEACDAVTDYWFEELGFSMLRAPKAAANTASRRISEKQGMRMVATEEQEYVSGRLLSEVWEITAEEWQAHKGRKSKT